MTATMRQSRLGYLLKQAVFMSFRDKRQSVGRWHLYRTEKNFPLFYTEAGIDRVWRWNWTDTLVFDCESVVS